MSTKPVIYVRSKGKNQSSDSIMIKLSNTLQKIMNDAAVALDRPQIKCLYDAEMNRITDIKQIKPGDLIICSILDQDDQSPIRPMKLFSSNVKSPSKLDESINKTDRQNSPSKSDIRSPIKQSPRAQSKMDIQSPSKQRIPSPSKVNNASPPREPSPIREKAISKQNIKPVSPILQEYSDSDNYQEPKISLPPDNTPKINSSPKSEYPQHLSDVNVKYVEGISDDDQNNDNHDKKDKGKDILLDENGSPDNKSIQSSPKKSVDAKSSVTKKQFETRQFIADNAERIEEAANMEVFKAFCSIIGDIPTHPTDLDDKVREILRNHTFICPGMENGCSFSGRIAIVGPNVSGKSTFLQILSKNYYQYLISTDNKRNTAVFYYDFKTLSKHTSNVFDFYGKFINTTLLQLADQYPLLRIHPQRKDAEDSSHSCEKTPIIDEILRGFIQFSRKEPFKPISSKILHIPPFDNLSHEFNVIIHEIKNIISNPNGMNDFLRLTFLIPQRLAHILNFNNVHFIIDHFDDIDVDVKPVSPFSTQNESKINVKQKSLKKETKFYHMIDYDKALFSNDFFVAAQNEENLLSLLDTFNIRISTEILSVVGLVKHESSLKEVKLEMKDGSTIVLLSDYLSGCSAFISKWEEISAKIKMLKPNGSMKITQEKIRLKVRQMLIDLVGDLISDIKSSVVNFTPVIKE